MARSGIRITICDYQQDIRRQDHDDATKVPAVIRRRPCGTRAAAVCIGATVAGQADPRDRSIHCRLDHRHHRAHRARAALGCARPAYRGREPGRRGRDHRHSPGRQGGARWPHAPDPRLGTLGGAGGLSERALPRGPRFCGSCDIRQRTQRDGDLTRQRASRRSRNWSRPPGKARSPSRRRASAAQRTGRRSGCGSPPGSAPSTCRSVAVPRP